MSGILYMSPSYNEMRVKSGVENLTSDQIPAVMTALIGPARKTINYLCQLDEKNERTFQPKNPPFLNTNQQLKDALDRSPVASLTSSLSQPTNVWIGFILPYVSRNLWATSCIRVVFPEAGVSHTMMMS
jgi:hypothetical protein